MAEGAKIPPQALDIEQAVLGSMLIDKDALDQVLNMLVKEDFYKPSHQIIYEAVANLYQKNNQPDILTLENELRDNGKLDLVGGSNYLTHLTNAVASAANVEYHSQIIAEKSLKRRLIQECNQVIEQAYENTSDAYDTLEVAESRVFKLASLRNQKESKNLRSILPDTIEMIEDLMNRKDAITGVPTGTDVDRFTTGFQAGQLIIIAARPAMGKTAFALTCARNAAMHENERLRTTVALFSLEMSSESLVQRLLTMEAGVDAQKVRKGQLDNTDFDKLIKAAGRMHTANIFIDDTPSLSISELRSKCRRLKQEHDIGLVVVDYLQLMTAKGMETGSREQEIATISRGLKAISMELKIPVVALSQLSRAVEQRGGDKRPQLSDLRESGSIEQDADIVMFLYRPEYYNKMTTEDGRSTENLAEVIIAKQRSGPTGTVELLFRKNITRFDNMAPVMQTPFNGAQETAFSVEQTDIDGNSNSGNNASSPPQIGYDPSGEDEAPF